MNGQSHPILQSIDPKRREPHAIVLVPTRELAVQVSGEFEKLGKHLGISVAAVYGGTPIGKQMRTLSDGILLTNGLGFSPDGRRLYHSDARAPLVRVYDVKEDGSVGQWRKFASLGETSVPDGLKVASDGSVWVADAHGGRVGVHNNSERGEGPGATVEVLLPLVGCELDRGGNRVRECAAGLGPRQRAEATR